MRVGNQMKRAVEIVAANEGCSKKYVAERISPHPIPERNWALGYAPVNRAIAAGLIAKSRGARNSYLLTVTDAGRELLRPKPTQARNWFTLIIIPAGRE